MTNVEEGELPELRYEFQQQVRALEATFGRLLRKHQLQLGLDEPPSDCSPETFHRSKKGCDAQLMRSDFLHDRAADDLDGSENLVKHQDLLPRYEKLESVPATRQACVEMDEPFLISDTVPREFPSEFPIESGDNSGTPAIAAGKLDGEPTKESSDGCRARVECKVSDSLQQESFSRMSSGDTRGSGVSSNNDAGELNKSMGSFYASEDGEHEHFVDEKLRRTYEAQFRRLDTTGGGRLQGSDLLHVLEEHYKDFELANIQDVIAYYNNKKSKSSSQVGKTVSRSRTSYMDSGLDLDAFIHLLTDHQLADATPIIRRDIHHLQKGLEEENNYNLHSDLGHVDEGKTLANRPWFDLPVIVICLNALTIGISLDDTENQLAWDIAEWIFFSAYILEASLKIWAFGPSGYFMGSERWWHRFDCFCIVTSVVDVAMTAYVRAQAEGAAVDLSSMMLIKMLRLARLARIIKTLRYPIFKELKLMVMGVVSGMRVLIWAIVLLLIVVYVLGIAATILIGHSPGSPAEFESLAASMFTLFRCFTDGCDAYDGTPLIERLRAQYGTLLMVAYVLTFMVVTVGIFNLITGVFIDNVMESQMNRKQEEISNTAEKIEVAIKGQLVRLLTHSKAGGVPDETQEEIVSVNDLFSSAVTRIRTQFEILQDVEVVITRSMFAVWLRDDAFMSVLREADIDVSNKALLFDVMDADGGGFLDIDELYTGLMQLRGPVSKNDIISILLRARHLVSQVESLTDKKSSGPFSRQTSLQ